MSRTTPSPKIRELAERLIAYESAAGKASEASMSVTLSVSGKLGVPLSTLLGRNSFRWLMARSVALAKKQMPGLSGVQVALDGSLEGVSNLGNQDRKAGGMLIAQLLGLLVTFLGEGLTFGLVREVWPELTDIDNRENNDHAPTG